MIRLLDANAFMEASRLYYGFDIAPGFWTWLSDPRLHGQVASVPAVRAEILHGTGPLVDWTKELPSEFWIEESLDTLLAMRHLAEWAANPDRPYTQAAVDEFMASADLRLIAAAKANAAMVVTRESPAPLSKKRIKIPDVCDAFGVPWASPFDTYRALGLRLG